MKRSIIFLALLITSISFAGTYSGGDGSSANPYQIANATDLLTLVADTNDYNKAFVLVNDINLADYTFANAVIAPDINSSSGFQGTIFTGVFDGNGHSILSLTIDTNGVNNSYLGLFGKTGSDSNIKNLGIEDTIIIGGSQSYFVGGLCGYIANSNITNCYSIGTVSGSGYETGGLCGYNDHSNIINCYSSSNVSGSGNNTGGLCGSNAYGIIKDCYSTGNVSGSDYTGGLVGNSYSSSIINCYSTDTVSGTQFVGGLCGENRTGNITNCYSTGNVNGNNRYTGGLCGSNGYSAILADCYSTGNVSGTQLVGGLCGSNESDVTNCYSTGNVNGNNYYTGGLCGSNGYSAILANCYSTGNVIGSYYTGGLCGDTFMDNIINCYSTGTVSGYCYTGGLCGSNYECSITNCYSTGTVSGSDSYPQYTGGLCGYDVFKGSYTHCYFLNTAGPDNGLGEPLTDVQMKQQASYTNWDFGSDIWIMDEGASYPLFIWQNVFVVAVVPNVTGMTEAGANAVLADANLVIGVVTTAYSPTVPQGYIIEQIPAAGILAVEGSAVDIVISLGVKYSGGSGEPNAPYLIATPADMNMLGASSGDWGKRFKLVADIDMSAFTGTQYKIIGYSSSKGFSGTFDGNGHKIYNLTYATTTSVYNVGMFGYVINATIKDLGVENVNVSTGGNYIGCLVGVARNSTIVNCYCTGTVLCSSASFSTAGGLVGQQTGGSIINGYSAVSVTAYEIAGGLVGSQMSSTTIKNCYSMGYISTFTSTASTWSHAGGLVGILNGGTITNCYSTCAVTCSSIYTSVAGGLVGDQSDRSGNTKIENCYFAGQLSATGSTVYKGGLLGYYSGLRTSVIAGNFWDIDISGTSDGVGNINPDPNGVMGKTTTEVQTQTTFTDAGWDFSYEDGNDAVWFMPTDKYPILTWQISDADLDMDGENNFNDFTIFARYWMREDCRIYNYYCEFADMDFDRDVDIDDLAEFMSYWLGKGIY